MEIFVTVGCNVSIVNELMRFDVIISDVTTIGNISASKSLNRH